jgi:hypothetical protein
VRRAWLLLLALPVLSGCGAAAEPRLAHTDAAGLISLADRISSEGACAQARDIPKLRSRTVALLNSGRVPAALQEPLLSGVNALAAPVCLPSVPASTTTPAVVVPTGPARRPGPPRPHGHGPGDHGHHGPGHGHHR